MFDFLDVYPWALPICIFFGRILDVSLGTLRIVFVAKGEKRIAPLIGFVEVFIWVVIISQVLSRANELTSYLAYAGGYATGTYIGLLVEARIGFGFIKFRIFTAQNGLELVKMLNEKDFGSTMTHGTGAVGEVDIVESVIRRKDRKRLETIIREFDPKVFTLEEDIRGKQLGVFASGQRLMQRK